MTQQDTPTAQRLKTRARDFNLGEFGMAALYGVPVFTYRKWENGTRTPDAAPQRLINLIDRMEHESPELFAQLIDEARTVGAPSRAVRARKRPAKGDAPSASENAPSAAPAPAAGPDAPSVPDWLQS